MRDLQEQSQAFRQHLGPRPQRSEQPSPPQESGTRLATFERPDAELRVNLQEYLGHQFVRIQLWKRDANNGTVWPVKGAGFSIKLRELPDLADAIGKAMELASGHQVARPQDEHANYGATDLPL